MSIFIHYWNTMKTPFEKNLAFFTWFYKRKEAIFMLCELDGIDRSQESKILRFAQELYNEEHNYEQFEWYHDDERWVEYI